MHTESAALVRNSSLAGLWRSLRPSQWIKNSFIFAALIFARRFTDPAAVVRSAYAFLLFCGASGAVYLINDLFDLQADRAHPAKRRRPIASGFEAVSARAPGGTDEHPSPRSVETPAAFDGGAGSLCSASTSPRLTVVGRQRPPRGAGRRRGLRAERRHAGVGGAGDCHKRQQLVALL